jgi:MoxR-like ATPase
MPDRTQLPPPEGWDSWEHWDKDFEDYQNRFQAALDEVETVMVGKTWVIRLFFAVWIAGYNFLSEDDVGVGKTMLIRTIEKVIAGASQARVQGTPDLYPSDIGGRWVYDKATGKQHWEAGPVENVIVLIDELNRMMERARTALIEPMEERKLTVPGTGEQRKMPKGQIIAGAQNPLTTDIGTFALTRAQRDRFIVQVTIGRPDTLEEELEMAEMQEDGHPYSDAKEVITLDDIISMRRIAMKIPMDREIKRWLVQFIRATDPKFSKEVGIDISDLVQLGASPRNSPRFIRMARTWAFVNGEKQVTCELVEELLKPMLRPRIDFTYNVEDREEALTDLIGRIMKVHPFPNIT